MAVLEDEFSGNLRDCVARYADVKKDMVGCGTRVLGSFLSDKFVYRMQEAGQCHVRG